jgi:hypothetical protein
LLVAAVAALCLTPPAFAHSTAAASQKAADACPAPEVTSDYDGERFSVHATLLASGCAAREHRQFSLSGWVSRVDDTTGEGHGRVVGCGPFQSSDDMDPDAPPRTYSCDIDLSVEHPAVERAQYEVEVTYPGADGDETVTFDSFCVSSEEGTSCSDEHQAR